jgi:hypothetical protein
MANRYLAVFRKVGLCRPQWPHSQAAKSGPYHLRAMNRLPHLGQRQNVIRTPTEMKAIPQREMRTPWMAGLSTILAEDLPTIAATGTKPSHSTKNQFLSCMNFLNSKR